MTTNEEQELRQPSSGFFRTFSLRGSQYFKRRSQMSCSLPMGPPKDSSYSSRFGFTSIPSSPSTIQLTSSVEDITSNDSHDQESNDLSRSRFFDSSWLKFSFQSMVNGTIRLSDWDLESDIYKIFDVFETYCISEFVVFSYWTLCTISYFLLWCLLLKNPYLILCPRSLNENI